MNTTPLQNQTILVNEESTDLYTVGIRTSDRDIQLLIGAPWITVKELLDQLKRTLQGGKDFEITNTKLQRTFLIIRNNDVREIYVDKYQRN